MEDKYIKWEDIWDEEIGVPEVEEDSEHFEMLEQFNNELKDNDGLELMVDECSQLENGNLYFVFGESGGQNESDTQGWSRDFTLEFEDDYTFVSIEYSQG